MIEGSKVQLDNAATSDSPERSPRVQNVIQDVESDTGLIRLGVGLDGSAEIGYDHAEAELRARAALARVYDEQD